MPAPQRIIDLVENFKVNFDHIQSSDFLEEDLRTNFLNPFFQELGWDMEDRAGKGVLRDVHYEKVIKSGAPDYGFYTDGKLRFFVEAKNPSIDVCNNQAAALQLRGYGWSAKVPLSILTDFEEFSIYDTTVKPNPSDSARVARVEGVCIKYTEIVERWDDIAATFSRAAVIAGSLDKQEKKNSKQAVDKELLVDISRWREMLAKNIANRNEVSEERLNRIVQDSIARILFLRICEDRGIAHAGELNSVTEGDGTYTKLYKLFKKAEQRYDSDLFEVESIANLVVDDKVLKEVISELYFPKSPYKFDAIPSEILGQVYEQFLGKVIRLTEGGHAKVELKPEVRKAGGIYYTPTYIVDYIVRNTVGKLVEGKTPKKIETLSIVDPACGSGSFLLGAYKFLADWYRDWYVTDDIVKYKKAKKIYQDKDKQWQLTLEEKKRILTTHIYGVDLDRQAVEMTKLSLMLEALRAPEQQSLFNDRMLPRLGDNIKCGNSLIASDFSTIPEDLVRVHAFDWSVQFESIMKSGGFDVVIGNPPYIRIQSLQDTDPAAVEYLKKTYKSATRGNYDIYVVFIEHMLNLLSRNGLLGYIVPHKFFNTQYGEPLRELLSTGRNLSEVVHFSDQQVFECASTYTCLLFLKKTPSDSFNFCKVADLAGWREKLLCEKGVIAAKAVTAGGWTFGVGPGSGLMERLKGTGPCLGDLTEIFVGLQTSADTVFLFKEWEISADITKVFSKELNNWVEVESALLKPVVRSGAIGRYWSTPGAKVIFPYELSEGKTSLIPEVKFAKKYPKAWSYLNQNKNLLSTREHGKFKEKGWYQLYPKNLNLWERPKLLVPYMITELAASLDMGDSYFVNVTTGGFGVVSLKKEYSLKYLCGLLNSSTLDFFLKRISTNFRGGYFAANKQFIAQLPIHSIDFADPEDVVLHDKLVSLVEKMLGLMPKLHATTSESEKTALQNAVTATDQQIDALVYELYGLTEEEIRVVEGTR